MVPLDRLLVNPANTIDGILPAPSFNRLPSGLAHSGAEIRVGKQRLEVGHRFRPTFRRKQHRRFAVAYEAGDASGPGATTAEPQAIASKITLPIVSVSEAYTKASAEA